MTQTDGQRQVGVGMGVEMRTRLGGRGAEQSRAAVFGLPLNYSLSCLMRTRDEHPGLTHAPCSEALSVSLFADNIITPLLSLVLLHDQSLSSLVAYYFFSLLFFAFSF